MAATLAKVFYGIPYVVDFRDPWKSERSATKNTGIVTMIYRGLISIFEPIVIKHASKIICVSEGMCSNFRMAYPNRMPSDFIMIPNGYDPSDYDNVQAHKFSSATIVYAGKFLSAPYFRNPKYFFEALKMLNERNIKIKFRHIGEVNPEVIQIAKECSVYEYCEFVGYLSYDETIKNMKGADLLLLIGTGDKIEQTGKIFDYLGCKRPILALANSFGGIYDVVSDLEHVTLIDNKNSNEIAEAIENIFSSPIKNPINEAKLIKYQRSELTMKLANIMDKVIDTEKS
jgi:glycosyltransferase involved in cell wall biosynthesis